MIHPLPSRARVRTRAARGDGDLLRREILAATEKLLLETGDAEAVSIRAISQAVGVSPPSIYLHFEDKSELIRAVCQGQFDQLEAQANVALVGVDDALDELIIRGRTYIDFALAHPEQYRILMMGKQGLTLEDFQAGRLPGSESLLAVVECIRVCMEQGRLTPADPMLVACSLWVSVHGITSLAITMPGFPLFFPLETLIDQVFDTTLRGLGAHIPPA
ncbi:MAG: TetR/AcrR family transcriptional regulator [Acidimicrobiales bacterium]